MNKQDWLHSKEHLYGPFTRIANPEIIEIIALAGYDFAVVDFEHGATAHLTDVYPLILAAQNRGLQLIARIPGINEMYIKWLLDLGIGGLQIPHIKNKDDAAKAISYAKFYPMGERGLCRFVRAAEFSNTKKEDYLNQSNENSFIILQIEGKEGVENIEEILSVSGIDILFVGPYDLSQSLGIPGDIWNPKVSTEIEKIISACNKKGVQTGIFTDTPSGVRHWRQLGIKYINYRIDTELFFSFAKTSFEEISQPSLK